MSSCKKAIIVCLAIMLASIQLFGSNAVQIIGGDVSKAKIYDANGKRFSNAQSQGIDELWVVQTQETDLAMTSGIADITLRQNSIFKIISLYSEAPTILLAEGACDITTGDLTYPLIVRTPVSSYTVVSNASFHILSNANAEIGYSNDSEVIVTNNITGRVSLLKKATLMEFQDWTVLPSSNIAQAFQDNVEEQLYTHPLSILDYNLNVILNSGSLKIKDDDQISQALINDLKFYTSRKGIAPYLQSLQKQGGLITLAYPSSMTNAAILSDLKSVLEKYLTWLFSPIVNLDFEILGFKASLTTRSTDVFLSLQASEDEARAVMERFSLFYKLEEELEQRDSLFTTDSDRFESQSLLKAVEAFNLAYRFEDGKVQQNPLLSDYDVLGRTFQASFYMGHAVITYPSEIKQSSLGSLIQSFDIENAELSKGEDNTLVIEYDPKAYSDEEMIRLFGSFIEEHTKAFVLRLEESEKKAQASRAVIEDAINAYLGNEMDVFSLMEVVNEETASAGLVSQDRPVALILGKDSSAGLYLLKTDKSNMPTKVSFSSQAVDPSLESLFENIEKSELGVFESSRFNQRIRFLDFDALLTASIDGQLNLVCEAKDSQDLKLFLTYLVQEEPLLDYSKVSYSPESGISFLYEDESQLTEIAQIVLTASEAFAAYQRSTSLKGKDFEIRSTCTSLTVSFIYSLSDKALSQVADFAQLKEALGPCTITYLDNLVQVDFEKLVLSDKVAKTVNKIISDNLVAYKAQVAKELEIAQREQKRSQFADISFNSDPEFDLFSYAFAQTRLPVYLIDDAFGLTTRFVGTYNFTASVASNFLGLGASIKPYYTKEDFAVALDFSLNWNSTDGLSLPFDFDSSSVLSAIGSLTRYISLVGYGYKSQGFFALVKENQDISFGSSSIFMDNYPNGLGLSLNYNNSGFSAKAYLDDIRFEKLLNTQSPQAQVVGLELGFRPLMNKDFEASFNTSCFGIINTDLSIRLLPVASIRLPLQGGQDRSSMLLAFGFDTTPEPFKFFVQTGLNFKFTKAELMLSLAYNKGSRYTSLINMTGKDKLFNLNQTTLDMIISLNRNVGDFSLNINYDLPLIIDGSDVVSRLNDAPDTGRNINWSSDLFSVKAAFYDNGISLVLGYGTYGLFSNFEGLSSGLTLDNLFQFAKNCLIPEYMNLFADARFDFNEFALGVNMVVKRYSAGTPATIVASFYTELNLNNRAY